MALFDIDLYEAFKLPPRQAIELFRQKGIVVTWDWWEAADGLSARAFTSAKVLKLDVLLALRDSITEALEEGHSNADFRKAVEGKLAAAGFLERALPSGRLPPHRLETIFRTNMQSAYNASRYDFFQENKEARPFLEYVAVRDSRTRDSHRALHGFVARTDDPIWRSISPPSGFNCRCTIRALTPAQVRARGKQVQDSRGFDRQSVAVGPNAESVSQITFMRDGQRFALDPGFANNPSLTPWEPNIARYPRALAALFNADNRA